MSFKLNFHCLDSFRNMSLSLCSLVFCRCCVWCMLETWASVAQVLQVSCVHLSHSKICLEAELENNWLPIWSQFSVLIMRENPSLDDTVRLKVERTLCSLQMAFKLIGVVETNFKSMLNSFLIDNIFIRTSRFCRRRIMHFALSRAKNDGPCWLW